MGAVVVVVAVALALVFTLRGGESSDNDAGAHRGTGRPTIAAATPTSSAKDLILTRADFDGLGADVRFATFDPAHRSPEVPWGGARDAGYAPAECGGKYRVENADWATANWATDAPARGRFHTMVYKSTRVLTPAQFLARCATYSSTDANGQRLDDTVTRLTPSGIGPDATAYSDVQQSGSGESTIKHVILATVSGITVLAEVDGTPDTDFTQADASLVRLFTKQVQVVKGAI